MSFFKEFRDFAVKGNALDLAVAVIIGGAFGKIVASLVGDVIMPLVGQLLGGVSFSEHVLNLGTWSLQTAEEAKAAGGAVLKYGQFLQTIVDFLIIALSIFVVIRQINRLKKPAPAPAPSAPTTKDCPRCLMTIPIKATRCGHCTTDLAK